MNNKLNAVLTIVSVFIEYVILTENYIFKQIDNLIQLFINWVLGLFRTLIIKSKKSKKVKNDVLSIIYFLMDMGPSVSAFTIPAMLLTSESTLKLTFIFVLGIIMKQVGRKVIRHFLKLTDNEKGV